MWFASVFLLLHHYITLLEKKKAFFNKCSLNGRIYYICPLIQAYRRGFIKKATPSCEGVAFYMLSNQLFN